MYLPSRPWVRNSSTSGLKEAKSILMEVETELKEEWVCISASAFGEGEISMAPSSQEGPSSPGLEEGEFWLGPLLELKKEGLCIAKRENEQKDERLLVGFVLTFDLE